MRLVDKERVDAEVGKADRLVFRAGVGFASEALGHAFLRLLHLFDCDPVALLGLDLRDGVAQVLDLLLEKLAQRVLGHADLLERAVSDDHGVPIAGRDATEQALAIFLLEVALLRNENVRVGIQRVESVLPLQQQMVRNDKHGLRHQVHALALHDGADAHERLAGADDVIE